MHVRIIRILFICFTIISLGMSPPSPFTLSLFQICFGNFNSHSAFDFILFLFLFSSFFFLLQLVASCKNISNASHFVDHSNRTQALRSMLLQGCIAVQGCGKGGRGMRLAVQLIQRPQNKLKHLL